MKKFLIINFFFFQILNGMTQILTIPGEYIYEEKIGLHSDGVPTTFGNLSYLPREPIVDTIVLHKLCLNDTHGAFLERDSSFNTVFVNLFDYEWIGNWQLNGDSLIVVFDKLIHCFPFSLSNLPATEVENLSEPLVMIYSINKSDDSIYLIRSQDYGSWDFQKE